MSVTDLDTPTVSPATDEDDLEHWVCCDDPHLTLCGIRDPDMIQTDFDEASCDTCENLADTHYCPRTGRNTCLHPAWDN